MIIGSHVAMKAPKMLAGSAKEAHSYDANAMMIFTGAPQNTRRKDVSEMNIPEGQRLLKLYGIDHIIGHAPYIINLGNTVKLQNLTFGISFMKEEIKRCDALGIEALSFHPGAHLNQGPEVALKQIGHALNEIIEPNQKVSIAIETMAGKGTEVGITFEQIAEIFDNCQSNDKLSVTMDTCHMSDAGYDVKNDFDGVLNEFDHIVGLDKLSVIHLNDSKNERGSHKDRHEDIGFGTIGFDALNYVAHHPQLENIPKIMETPYVKRDENDKKGIAPFKPEIEMLRLNKFDPEMKTKLIQANQKS
ncbi:deoxyribonuclease IV [Companilactobacillus alimentarius]|uniref:Probable endonuclease 4 n=1 Tax=Companilactobacillus alimentarius DSM 20249 TaxID=1423720 RepID=A0A2K9HFD7_9LACO|nr:deoxyribonuclease IV [Companilactobacillus alimentarius]AUI71271.1 deoxyribonuclease IV [Companilactobacillus alimentarius DSM 20249]KRK75410.1 endonuclease IV [Companilactobacillus alimentarius DSM 20249]GEO43806.1 putative endonuclease 4 [Companilactobacillus alimentarius]